MSKHWRKLRHLIMTGAFFRYGPSQSAYTAKASFKLNEARQGVVFDIRRTDTFSSYTLNNTTSTLFLITQFSLLTTCGIMMRHEPTHWGGRAACIFCATLQILLMIGFILLSNTKILKRMMCLSGITYIKLYICCIETAALASLLQFNFRAIAVAPILLVSQMMIFVSDAVFYHFHSKKPVIIMILLFLGFRVYLIMLIYLGWMEETHPAFVELFGLHFFNQGTFISKSSSIIMFMLAQLIFHVKHRFGYRLFSIRTCYTVLQNREWYVLERQTRVEHKKTMQKQVSQSHLQIQIAMPNEIRV